MDLNVKKSHNTDGDTHHQSNDTMEHDKSDCKQRKEGQQFLSSLEKYV